MKHIIAGTLLLLALPPLMAGGGDGAGKGLRREDISRRGRERGGGLPLFWKKNLYGERRLTNGQFL